MRYSYKTKPFEHQREALKKGALLKKFAYFMEQGTGKTKVTIDNAAYLHSMNEINTVLVIAPNSVYRNWEDELEAHCPVDYKVQSAKTKKPLFVGNGLNYFLTNIESFSRKSGAEKVKKLIDEYADKMMVVIDESTTIKNHTAKRTKNLIKLTQKVKYKRILSGTPVTKSPLDLYSQCDFLNKELLGFNSFYTFRARYCYLQPIPSKSTGRQIMLPLYFTNLGELEHKLDRFSYRVRKQDCLDLPDKIYQQRFVELKGSQLEVYNNLKTFARAMFKDKEATFTNKLSEIVKLHQVCCGYFVSDEGEVKDLENPKLDELLNIIEESDGKIIIWANYVKSIENIVNTLQKKYGETSVVSLYGAVKVDDRKENVRKFDKDPNVRFFVGNPVTGGYGLNLVSSNTVIYFSNNYDLEVRLQSEDRAHRIKQKNKVTYIDITCKNTIEEFILKALRKKLKISAQTLGEEVLDFL